MAEATLVPGTLEMLILKVVALQPLHGFGLGQRIEQISGGVFAVNAGSLLPALARLERSGWVRSEWKETASHRRAKYYFLTKAGQRRLAEETQGWGRQVAAVARILEAKP